MSPPPPQKDKVPFPISDFVVLPSIDYTKDDKADVAL